LDLSPQITNSLSLKITRVFSEDNPFIILITSIAISEVNSLLEHANNIQHQAKYIFLLVIPHLSMIKLNQSYNSSIKYVAYLKLLFKFYFKHIFILLET
jgi:hypothetical protein